MPTKLWFLMASSSLLVLLSYDLCSLRVCNPHNPLEKKWGTPETHMKKFTFSWWASLFFKGTGRGMHTFGLYLVLLYFISLSIQVRDQDATYVLAGISLEGGEVAWRWLKVCISGQLRHVDSYSDNYYHIGIHEIIGSVSNW